MHAYIGTEIDTEIDRYIDSQAGRQAGRQAGLSSVKRRRRRSLTLTLASTRKSDDKRKVTRLYAIEKVHLTLSILSISFLLDVSVTYTVATLKTTFIFG